MFNAFAASINDSGWMRRHKPMWHFDVGPAKPNRFPVETHGKYSGFGAHAKCESCKYGSRLGSRWNNPSFPPFRAFIQGFWGLSFELKVEKGRLDYGTLLTLCTDRISLCRLIVHTRAHARGSIWTTNGFCGRVERMA